MPSRRAGLTLVELCVTLAVVAIVASQAVPNLQQARLHQRLRALAEALRTDLQDARALAIRHGRPVRVFFGTAAGGSCYVVHDGAAADCRCGDAAGAHCLSGAAPLRYVWLPAAARVELDANRAEIAIRPGLGTVTPTLTVALRSAAGERVDTVVGIAGRIRSCTPDAGTRWLPACA
ncbi:MAG: GspH/FimT family pseudopilin [Pelomonas sp.]|nr:GspH/FimT family pseudopilin [Roseateles sp.]